MMIMVHERIDLLIEGFANCPEITGEIGIVIRVAHGGTPVHDEPGMMTNLCAIAIPFARFAHFLADGDVLLHGDRKLGLHASFHSENPDVADRATLFLVAVGECIHGKQ